ncbi:TolC family outer membrane protein [Nitrincola alkalilacustris]|uniref:TolC family outer membrane protein n=1 Tax=Nitrincola alkalilacustris TaxID=1571224 RepID=UPI00124D2CD8|nr:TolC family outer membrane protein [Nitrincola alkalilacustris]
MKRLSTLTLALLLTFNQTQADEQQPVTESGYYSDLLTLYQQAQSADPRIISAEASTRLGEYREREAFGSLLPQISADARITQTHYRSGQTETDYAGERFSISLNQIVFDRAVWQSYQRYRAIAEQQSAEGVDNIQHATIDLIQRYFEVLAAEDSLALISAEKEVVAQNLSRINSLFERQLVPITDQLDVAARLDRLISDEISADNQVQVARERLTEILGRPVDEKLKRLPEKPDLGERFQLSDLDYWRDQALANNHQLIARMAALNAQRAAQREAFSGHLPRVTASLSAQQTNIGFENAQSGRTESGVAALNFQIPLFSGGSVSARNQAAYEGITLAQQDLETVRRQVMRETRVAYLNSKASISKIHAALVALESASKAREAAERSFSFGITNVVDVLDRTRAEFSANRDLLESQYNFIMSYMVLKRWSGTLDESDIIQVNELLSVRSDAAEG